MQNTLVIFCIFVFLDFQFVIYLEMFLITNIFSIAVVFARLIVNGKNEGLHGVLVRIRDNNMKVMPGVTVEDMGHKMGLNGVDNAKLSFDQVNSLHITRCQSKIARILSPSRMPRIIIYCNLYRSVFREKLC